MARRLLAASLVFLASHAAAAPMEVLPGWSAHVPDNWVLVNKAGIDNLDPEWQRVARMVEANPGLRDLVLSGTGAVLVRLNKDRTEQSGDILTLMLREDVHLSLEESVKARMCADFASQGGPQMRMQSCELASSARGTMFRTIVSDPSGAPWSNFSLAKTEGRPMLYAIGHFRSDSVSNKSGLAGEVERMVSTLRSK